MSEFAATTQILREQSSHAAPPPAQESLDGSMAREGSVSPSQQQQHRRHLRTTTTTATTASSRPISGRRRLKSALYFALAILSCSSLLAVPSVDAFSSTAGANRSSGMTQRQSEWIAKSIKYYSGVMKTDAGSNKGKKKALQIDSSTSIASTVTELANDAGTNDDIVAAQAYDIARHDKDFVRLATNHYYARLLIKSGKWSFAEAIYRRIIGELTSNPDEDDCDHTKLAVSTLLLALHLQRTGDVKATRAVFLNFFRRVALDDEEEDDGETHHCSCSAKVLQAYALFEMKCGHSAKSLEIIRKAIRMDEELRPVLGWKQFRDAAAGREYNPTFSFRKGAAPARA